MSRNDPSVGQPLRGRTERYVVRNVEADTGDALEHGVHHRAGTAEQPVEDRRIRERVGDVCRQKHVVVRVQREAPIRGVEVLGKQPVVDGLVLAIGISHDERAHGERPLRGDDEQREASPALRGQFECEPAAIDAVEVDAQLFETAYHPFDHAAQLIRITDMRVVLQRVSSASVSVDDRVVGRVDAGLVALVGIGVGDGPAQADALAAKTAALRIFDAESGARSVRDVGGAVLVISQFTLLADTRRGNRPSWIRAAPPDAAAPLVARYAETLSRLDVPVSQGIFGAHMVVELVNDGPVTIVLDEEGT